MPRALTNSVHPREAPCSWQSERKVTSLVPASGARAIFPFKLRPLIVMFFHKFVFIENSIPFFSENLALTCQILTGYKYIVQRGNNADDADKDSRNGYAGTRLDT